MPAKFIAVPFAVVLDESNKFTFPVPKEAQPSTRRFGASRNSAASSSKKNPSEVITRAVKLTSASFTPAKKPSSLSEDKKDSSSSDNSSASLTSLVFTTKTMNADEPQSFTIVAFSQASSSAPGPSPSSSSSSSQQQQTIQLNTRLFIDSSTTLSVVGGGTIALVGEEFHETFTPSATKRKRLSGKFNKLPADGEEEGSDFDDGRSFGADDMYEQGIVYN